MIAFNLTTAIFFTPVFCYLLAIGSAAVLATGRFRVGQAVPSLLIAAGALAGTAIGVDALLSGALAVRSAWNVAPFATLTF